MNGATETNRMAWDEMASIHAGGNSLYAIEAFKRGNAGLAPNTPDKLGDVRGKRLLHLQCHIGLDSLAWVRQGAIVTGIDFSPTAVAEARKLALETRLSATFIESDATALPSDLSGQFDIVLTYFGTITWLADLKSWASGIARCLKPGGFFYLADCHPIAQAMDVPPGESIPRPSSKYFNHGSPLRCDSAGGTYAAPDAATVHNVTYQWIRPLQEVLSALLSAGLRLEYLHEFPYTFYEKFRAADRKLMRRDAQGWWHLVDADGFMPLMFSTKFVKAELQNRDANT